MKPVLRSLQAFCLTGLMMTMGSVSAQELGDPQLGEAHSVESGDTLWDLCSKYLNSPWYWPKIWSYNPQLSNPHWIYPGNEIRFYPGDEALPTQVSVSTTLTDDDEDLTIPGELTEDELVQTVGTIYADAGPVGALWTTNVGYLSKDAVRRLGRIANSASEAVLLDDYDRVYIEGQALKEGDRLAIFHAVREIKHPVTGENYGMAVEIVGSVAILRTSQQMSTGQIMDSYRPVSRGDLVGPFPENFTTRIREVPNQVSAKGYVIETSGDVLAPIGQHNLVYVDRGRNHGIQLGNTFEVLDQGDGFTEERDKLPLEVVGKLMVLDVQAEASTAIIVRSVRELAVGDKIVMAPQ